MRRSCSRVSTEGVGTAARRGPCVPAGLGGCAATNAAVDLHADDSEFGYRLIANEMHHAGHRVSENRVYRLCSAQRLWSAHAKKRGLSRKPGPPVHDDLVGRNFAAPAVNVKWLTDITEHRPVTASSIYVRSRTAPPTESWTTRSAADDLRARGGRLLRNAIAPRSPHGRSCTTSWPATQIWSGADVERSLFRDLPDNHPDIEVPRGW
jgi:hypothetical protein